jgi:hypothetical protein
LEVAVEGAVRRLPSALNASVFSPALKPAQIRDVNVLAVESILVHMAAKPSDVRSWASAGEWFGDLAALAAWDGIGAELEDRAPTVRARAGYLLQGVRPDLAERIAARFPVTSRTWFGPRGPAFRHDPAWRVADSLLPFDPRALDAAR